MSNRNESYTALYKTLLHLAVIDQASGSPQLYRVDVRFPNNERVYTYLAQISDALTAPTKHDIVLIQAVANSYTTATVDSVEHVNSTHAVDDLFRHAVKNNIKTYAFIAGKVGDIYTMPNFSDLMGKIEQSERVEAMLDRAKKDAIVSTTMPPA